MKLGFYLMNQKGFQCLEAFLKQYNSINIVYVVSAKDEGTKENYYKKIKDLCFQENIKFISREKIKDETEIVNYKIAIGWRWIISESDNLIVFHDSILPKYRGFCPLVNMLINGESKIGVTALLASAEYDCGDVCGQKSIAISYPIKIQKAIDLVSDLYCELLIEIIENLKKDSLKFTVQDEEGASYSLWRDEEDYQINWNDSSRKIRRFVDAVGFPFAGAVSFIKDKKVRILEVKKISDKYIENRSSNLGKIIFFEGNSPVVVCGTGLLKITKITDTSCQNLKLNFRTRFQNKN